MGVLHFKLQKLLCAPKTTKLYRNWANSDSFYIVLMFYGWLFDMTTKMLYSHEIFKKFIIEMQILPTWVSP